MVTAPKARKIFDVMIERDIIPRSGTFEVTDALLEESFFLFR